MTRDDLLLWGLGGALVAYFLYNQQGQSALNQGAGSIYTGVEDVTAAVSGWASVNQGPTWVPVINETEASYGIPANMLARMAYQESHFRPDIIAGTTASPAGALGILQLEPAYFQSVNVPLPFTTQDTLAQISEAAQEFARLYGVYADWGAALAAYNWGQGNVTAYLAGQAVMPKETIDYVTEILADVPVPSTFQV